MSTTEEGLGPAADLLRALAHPVRLSVILELREAPRCVHELVDILGVTQPLASQHLRVLREAGLITGTRRGREVAYEISDDHVLHIAVDAITHARERTPA